MAAQNGVFRFYGQQTRMSYDVSVYFDDTAGNFVLFDQSAKASAASNDRWIAPESCVLSDIVLAAATGQTTTQLMRNATPTGDYLLNALHLASVVFRPQLRVKVPRGSQFQAKQLA